MPIARGRTMTKTTGRGFNLLWWTHTPNSNVTCTWMFSISSRKRCICICLGQSRKLPNCGCDGSSARNAPTTTPITTMHAGHNPHSPPHVPGYHGFQQLVAVASQCIGPSQPCVFTSWRYGICIGQLLIVVIATPIFTYISDSVRPQAHVPALASAFLFNRRKKSSPPPGLTVVC